MRFKLKAPPKVGDKRIKTKFLFFLKEINREVRWLETATWEEEYIQHNTSVGHKTLVGWVTRKWIDEPPIVSCAGCKNEIDPDVCHCGNYIDKHGWSDNHTPVPIGCTCYYSK